MKDMEQLKLITEHKMEGHFEAKNVNQRLTNFLEQLYESVITSRKDVDIYERIV